jgi:iron complex outermembrane receptor protein
VGGRYDHYSDFGGEFSPRAGLSWEFVDNYYLKLLYGRAFRAPTFNELYNPWMGNPDLEPETMDTYELSLGGKLLSSLSGQVTLFYSKAKDLILVGDPPIWYQTNRGTARSKGVELQLKYDFGRGTYLAMNYTYLDTEFRDPDTNPWWYPRQMGTLTANIRLNRYLNLNTHLIYRDKWCRMNVDPRDDPPDYAIVNATLIARKFLKGLEGLELRGSVYNLFDKEYTAPTGMGQLPGDYPRPGRNFLLEMRYKF